MRDYILQEEEVILYEGTAYFDNGISNKYCNVLLTNLNLVIVIKTKKLFQKEQIEIQIYPISDLKVYDGIPQFKQKNNKVEAYFTSGEFKLQFDSKLNVIKFMNAGNKLMTGKSMSERGADKIKGAVNLVDNTLGINSMDAIKGVVEKGVVGAVVGGIGKKTKFIVPKSTAGKITDMVGVAKKLTEDKNTVDSQMEVVKTNTVSLDDQIESLKKLKELLDAGILTQEEFDTKKKQIMEF